MQYQQENRPLAKRKVEDHRRKQPVKDLEKKQIRRRGQY